MAALVQTANVQDNHGAVPLLRSIGRRFPRDEWIDQTLAWLAGAIDRWLQPAGDALANGVAIGNRPLKTAEMIACVCTPGASLAGIPSRQG